MGLDKHNIPDEYLCEVCKPRPIDRKRAKALQSRRRTEIAANSSSSEDSNKRGPFSKSSMKGSRSGKGGKKMLDRKNDKSGAKKAMAAFNKLGKKALAAFTDSQNSKSLKSLKDKSGKKTYRKRKPSEKENKKASKRLNRRKSLSYDKDLTEKEDDEDEDDEDDEDALLEPQHEASQHLRSWIDQYEEAVTNHYSQELRARLAGNKFSSDLRPSIIGGAIKCNVSLKGNGVKVRLISFSISPLYLLFFSEVVIV